MTMEIWKPCVGFEDFYEVSNEGRVRSLAVWSHKYQRILKRKSPVLKAQETTIDGYKRVLLCLYGVHHHCAVHRLVAMAFLPNDCQLPEVNHKDENPANNKVENLEWCTREYNANYGTLPKRISVRSKNAVNSSKAVNQYELDGKLISTFPSLNEAARQLGTITGDMIGRACKGKAKTAGGYLWKYVE